MDNEDIILINIEPHFAGDYRLEYDGKYITLYGLDSNYKSPCYGRPNEYYLEEMVLHPCIFEGRGLKPKILTVTDEYITVKLR